MYRYGRRSTENLATCHKDLQDIFNEAIKYIDIAIVEGHRPQPLQNKYFLEKKTKINWLPGQPPPGMHNQMPSLAVDFVPCDEKGVQQWDRKFKEKFLTMAYFIKGIAMAKFGIELRLGCDWNGNFMFSDETFEDWPHVELRAKLINGQWVRYRN